MQNQNTMLIPNLFAVCISNLKHASRKVIHFQGKNYNFFSRHFKLNRIAVRIRVPSIVIRVLVKKKSVE